MAKTECVRVRGHFPDSDPFLEVQPTFLRPAEQGSVFFDRVVYLNDSCARQQLHDHARRDNGRDTLLHEGSPVGRQNHPHPVELVVPDARRQSM